MSKGKFSPLQLAAKVANLKGKFDVPGDKESNTAALGNDKVLEIEYDNEHQSPSTDSGSLRRGFPFLPQVGGARSMGAGNSLNSTGTSAPKPNDDEHKSDGVGVPDFEKRAAPEKALTLFAMRLAILEKIASSVGALGFVWATVVILGGFAITMKEIDFWFVTIILATEGARIFSRSHELEFQHQNMGAENSLSDRALRATSKVYKRGSDVLHKSTRFVRLAFSAFVSSGREPLATTVVSGAVDSPGGAHNEPPSKSEDRQHLPAIKRTWSSSRVPFVPYLSWTFRAKNVSRGLYCSQLASAVLSIGLSVYRLSTGDFIKEGEVDTKNNHRSALEVFYSLALFEAMVFLFERAYWQWTVSVKKILIEVNKLCALKPHSLYTVRRFFYDVYSKCLAESVFEGLKMDLVSYSMTMLQSDNPNEQLGGIRVLAAFVSRKEFAEDTLRRISTTLGAVERLIEMITWKNPRDEDVRKAAAEVLCTLVKYNRSSIQVAAIPGSIEAIFTLMEHDKGDDSFSHFKDYIRQGGSEPLKHTQREFRLLGLRILKNLAKDQNNCAKIGTSTGLLERLTSFSDTDYTMLRNTKERDAIRLVKKSLELLRLLAISPGKSGKMLREEIAKVVFTITNLRNILEYGESQMMLQQRATEIISGLALDGEIREVVGRTGGIIRNLFSLFLKEREVGDGNQVTLATKAGEALIVLALQSEKNCQRMLRLRLKVHNGEKEIVDSLIRIVRDRELGHLAVRILRSFCKYTEAPQKAIIAACTPEIVKLVMEERSEALEAAIGLAACTIKLLNKEEFEAIFSEELTKAALVGKLGDVLENHDGHPSVGLPRIRRFAVELMISLVERDPQLMRRECQERGFKRNLERMLDTCSDLENFTTFSGAVGVTRNRVTIEELIEMAMAKIELAGKERECQE